MGRRRQVADRRRRRHLRGGGITTKQAFGDCQLHVEWASPAEVKGKGQGRGNSGVYLQGRYEVQILDSYKNETYFDGQCGAIYKQHPPLVNACRKPGEWQTYDIIFSAPEFDDDGKLEKPACITVLHNGVLIQNHFATGREHRLGPPARVRGASARSCRSTFRTTATPCASATSGSASCSEQHFGRTLPQECKRRTQLADRVEPFGRALRQTAQTDFAEQRRHIVSHDSRIDHRRCGDDLS